MTVQWGFCIATVKYLNTVYTEREPTIGFDFTGIETAHVSHRPVMVSLISPWGLSASLSFCEPYSGGPFIPAPHLKTENQYTPQLTKSGSIYIYKLHFYHYTYSELVTGIAELSFHLFCSKKVVKNWKTLSDQKPHLLLRSLYVWHWFYCNRYFDALLIAYKERSSSVYDNKRIYDVYEFQVHLGTTIDFLSGSQKLNLQN